MLLELPKNQQLHIIKERLTALGHPNWNESNVFSLLRENCLNQYSDDAQQNLARLREPCEVTDGSTSIPPAITSELEKALRAGELGRKLQITYLATLIHVGEPLIKEERQLVTECKRFYDLAGFRGYYYTRPK